MLSREHRCEWRERVEALEREVHRLREESAFEDPDTGLGNLVQLDRDFTKLVSRFRRHGEPFCLVLIRVAGFGGEGHALTKSSIARLARALAETARIEDSLSRAGEAEFAVLLPHCDLDGGDAFVSRARTNICREPVPTRDGTHFLQAVGGAAEWSEAAGTLLSLLQQADAAADAQEAVLDIQADNFRARAAQRAR